MAAKEAQNLLNYRRVAFFRVFHIRRNKQKNTPQKKKGLGDVRWPFGPHLTLNLLIPKQTKKTKKEGSSDVRWPKDGKR